MARRDPPVDEARVFATERLLVRRTVGGTVATLPFTLPPLVVNASDQRELRDPRAVGRVCAVPGRPLPVSNDAPIGGDPDRYTHLTPPQTMDTIDGRQS